MKQINEEKDFEEECLKNVLVILRIDLSTPIYDGWRLARCKGLLL